MINLNPFPSPLRGEGGARTLASLFEVYYKNEKQIL
jgi:hypothetical protein